MPDRPQKGPEIQPVLVAVFFKNTAHFLQKKCHGLLHNPQHAGRRRNFLRPDGGLHQLSHLCMLIFLPHPEPGAGNAEQPDGTLLSIRD